MEQITEGGVTLTVTLRDTGKEHWVWVYIANQSNDAVDVLPAKIMLHQKSPKDEDLRMKTEKELQKSIGQHVFWGQVIAGVSAGVSYKLAQKTGYDPGEAQARWLAWADDLTQKGKELTDFHRREWLRANTLFPGSQYAGRLIFIRDKEYGSGFVRIPVGSKIYDFPFPPPQAGHPDAAPVLPAVGSVTAVPVGHVEVSEAVPPTTRRAGVLGIAGTNWQDGGSKGVEITGIAPDSAAELAGLQVGNVIIEMNGRKIRSTQDLAEFLAENGPGTKLTVYFVFKSNLGWMPKEKILVLTDGS